MLGCTAAGAQSLTDRKALLGNEGPMLNVALDSRFDLRYTGGKDGTEYSNFSMQNLRLVVTGEIYPGITYRWRQRLNRPATTNADGSGNATDHLWVAFTLGHKKEWTITAGKQVVQLGTYDFCYNAADTYLGTTIAQDFDNTRIGVNTAYRFAGQTINLQVMNSGPQMTSQNYSTRGFAAATMWEGSLLDNAIGTRIGYSVWQHESSDFYQWFSGGIQANTGIVTTELDFYRGDRYLDYNTIVTERTGRHHVRDMTAAANVRFNLGKWRPSIKGIWERRRDMELESNVYGNIGIQTLIEYYPFTAELLRGLRFHVMYYYRTTNFYGPFSETPDKGTHTAMIGMRWMLKVK